MSLLKDFEALCKYVRECTGDDIVCGLCEYDAGTVGEEPIECPGFESNECFVLKESLRRQYERYDEIIRCKDCRYYDGANCTRKQGCRETIPEGFCGWAIPKVCTYNETGCGSCKLQTKCPVDEPAVDAVPVRHGKWKLIRMEDNGDGFYTCSNCDRGDIHSPLVSVPYCWYCGARMDEE